jgi:hypothetical protein
MVYIDHTCKCGTIVYGENYLVSRHIGKWRATLNAKRRREEETEADDLHSANILCFSQRDP